MRAEPKPRPHVQDQAAFLAGFFEAFFEGLGAFRAGALVATAFLLVFFFELAIFVSASL